jgi:large subunit ribosomal protein L46
MQLHPTKYVSFGFANPTKTHPLWKTCVFFLKAHIMAGQVRPGESVTDFAWLTKKEVSERVGQQYWDGVKDMLSDF